MNWLIIVLLVIFVLIVLKFKEVRHKLGFLILLLIFLFLVVTAFNVYKNNKVDISTFDGLVSAGKIYFSWLGSVVDNVKGISGYASKQEWSINNTKTKTK